MSVNKRWNMSSDICPVCYNASEDWYHNLTCKSTDLSRVRSTFIQAFRKLLNKHRTYPPLRDFILEWCINFPLFKPPLEPLRANQRYINLFHDAYMSQTFMRWQNFSRGFLSTKWKNLQYKHLVELVYGDIHALDKWAAKERDLSYEGRQRKKLWRLCYYLKNHPNELPEQKHHLIDKNESYFSRQPFHNIMMWKRHVDIILDPNYLKEKEKISSHFKNQPSWESSRKHKIPSTGIIKRKTKLALCVVYRL